MRLLLGVVALCVVARALPFDSSKRIERIALGSCNDDSRPQPLWPEIVSYKPDVFAWLGDITYADRHILGFIRLPGTNESMREEFANQKRNPGYQQILKASQVVGVADDHDYGLNDADWRNPVKDIAQAIVLDFLDEPADSHRRKQQGLNASYVWGPRGQRVKLILLDIRYHQDSEKQTILGEAQWEWLEEELRNNDAQLTLVASGIQIVTPNKFGAEGWKGFPRDRYRLFELLAKYCTDSAVLLLSGDVHLAEFARTHICLPSPDESAKVLPLWDLTTSGLTHAWGTMHGILPEWLATPLAHIIMGKIVTLGRRDTLVGESFLGLNWGALTIDWEAKPAPRLKMEVHGLKGAVPLQFDLSLDELKPRTIKPDEAEHVLRDCRAEVLRRDSPPQRRVSALSLGLSLIALTLGLAAVAIVVARRFSDSSGNKKVAGKAAKKNA